MNRIHPISLNDDYRLRTVVGEHPFCNIPASFFRNGDYVLTKVLGELHRCLPIVHFVMTDNRVVLDQLKSCVFCCVQLTRLRRRANIFAENDCSSAAAIEWNAALCHPEEIFVKASSANFLEELRCVASADVQAGDFVYWTMWTKIVPHLDDGNAKRNHDRTKPLQARLVWLGAHRVRNVDEGLGKIKHLDELLVERPRVLRAPATREKDVCDLCAHRVLLLMSHNRAMGMTLFCTAPRRNSSWFCSNGSSIPKTRLVSRLRPRLISFQIAE